MPIGSSARCCGGDRVNEVVKTACAASLVRREEDSSVDRGLEEQCGLDRKAASHLMGQVVRYDIGNVVDPASTPRLCCSPRPGCAADEHGEAASGRDQAAGENVFFRKLRQ